MNDQRSDRRAFLKQSAVAVGGVGLAGCTGHTMEDSVDGTSTLPAGEPVHNGLPDDPKNLRLVDYAPQPQLVTDVTNVPRAKYTAIDCHNHLEELVERGSDAIDSFVREMDENNVQAVVNLDGKWGEALDRQLKALKEPYPDRFYIYARIDFSRIDEPDFGEQAAEQLERGYEKGAQGLKISKDLGLGVRFEDGSYVPVDTPKMDPVWEKCGELGLPVEIHTSDPKAFFDPFDRHNERYEELVDNQDWMFNDPEYYGKDELLQQRNNVIERHPDTTFIGAHMGNLPENLNRVDKWLEKYDNFYVDVDARLSELGRQPYSARKFIIKWQDRVLFGTDGNAMDQPLDTMYDLHWRFLETDDENFDIAKSHKFQARWNVHGLYLPDEVLEKIYQTNALKLIPESRITI